MTARATGTLLFSVALMGLLGRADFVAAATVGNPAASLAAERWMELPADVRRCRLAQDRASMRLGPKIVLRELGMNPGEVGPEGAAYAVSHAGNESAQERRFVATIRKGCRSAFLAPPLPADRSATCRAPCAVDVVGNRLSDLEFTIACERCRLGNAAKGLALKMRMHGLPKPVLPDEPPRSIEQWAWIFLRGEFGSDQSLDRRARGLAAEPGHAARLRREMAECREAAGTGTDR